MKKTILKEKDEKNISPSQDPDSFSNVKLNDCKTQRETCKPVNVIEPAQNIHDPSKMLLLGDASVSDVSSTLPELQIKSNVYNDLLSVYKQLKTMSIDSVKSAILSIGVADCKSSKSAEQVLKDFEILLNEANRVSNYQPTISSICLRSKFESVQTKIDKVNVELPKLCDKFIDHSMHEFYFPKWFYRFQSLQ